MTKQSRFVALTVCAVSLAAPALADSVTDWNTTALQTVVAAVPPRAAPVFFLDVATVQAAIHDAVQAYQGRFEPYADDIPGATGSIDAAIAKAAHDVLVNRFPAQSAALDLTYNNYLTGKGIDPNNDDGVAIGAAAAAAVILKRSTDGSFPMPPPVDNGSTEPGQWRPTESFLPGPPMSFSPMGVPWFATITPFTLGSPSQYRPVGGPAIHTGLYTLEFNEVKRLGRDVNSERTQEQTDLAIFWALNYATQWNKALRDIVLLHVPDIGDSARLLALANMAMTDAAITAWDCKVTHRLWRPLTAIREAENDGNKHTDPDPDWKPMINTPNYPDSCSGANSVTAAGTEILSQFFGTDHFEFVMTSSNAAANPPTRTYTRFSDAQRDVVDVRVYQGVHFRSADEDGRKNGIKVGKWAFDHALRPVGE
jgi:hypothetical protein